MSGAKIVEQFVRDALKGVTAASTIGKITKLYFDDVVVTIEPNKAGNAQKAADEFKKGQKDE